MPCVFLAEGPAVSIFLVLILRSAYKNNPHKGLFFGGKTTLWTTGPMGKTPATENRSTHGMNTPCGTATDVTVERLLFSKGRGKEEAGDTHVGIGGYAGGTNQNGAEETPFVFAGLGNRKIIRGGSRKRDKRKRIHRHHRNPWLIDGNLDGRRDQRDMRWLRHDALYHVPRRSFNFMTCYCRSCT